MINKRMYKDGPDWIADADVEILGEEDYYAVQIKKALLNRKLPGAGGCRIGFLQNPSVNKKKGVRQTKGKQI